MIKLTGPVGKLVSLKTPSYLLVIGMSCEENGRLKRIVADLSLGKGDAEGRHQKKAMRHSAAAGACL